MNNIPSTSKKDDLFEDNEIFEDSSLLANFDNTSFEEALAGFSESNINDSHNKSGLNVSALCCDEELSGFDKLTGRTWIYPTNYPVRDYQFNIINAAILKNTLVSLPTGLGKTFIAAVIMYNFYRWYPTGKIIFTAPTRPLVAQQIEACYNVVAIPPSDTVEMTGHMQQNIRKTHWQTKRVFFATPQVIYNDIKSGICPGDKIRCLVVDEAHRARGNYAYCQIVGTLTDMGHKLYRVLALSATPGSKVEDVVNVVKNLHIAHLELRSEGCIDVARYSHARSINTELVPLGAELTRLRRDYIEILDGYARNLKDCNILPHNLGNLSKGRIVMLYKEFQSKDRSARHPRHNYIMKDFTILIALFHGLELLLKHGSRVFLNFFDEHPEKSWIHADDRLTAFLERLRDDLGVNPLSLNRSILPDGTTPEIPQNISFGHPKFYKLKEIMLEHFNAAKRNGTDTRAIVFCEYRESVNLVHCLLLQCRPLIVPQMFVGQGAGGKDSSKACVSQKQQLRVMRSFREGDCNTLVATCVAEEGLDVGSVDLIICFDVSTRSPIRLVQRCGRTGRERGGKVFILVTEGREHQTLQDCMRQRDALNSKVLASKEVRNCLYAANPRMLPRDLTPTCQKMFITVRKDVTDKGQKDLRKMLLGKSSSSKEGQTSTLIEEQEFNSERFGNSCFDNAVELWAMDKAKITELSKKEETGKVNLSKWLEQQRVLQKTINIGHSKDTEILSSILKYSDTKKLDRLREVQNCSMNTQDFSSQKFIASPLKTQSPVKVASPMKPKQTKKKLKHPLSKSPAKKDGDIRALFSTGTKSTKNYTKLISDLGIKNDGSIPTRIINLLVDLHLETTNISKTCLICQNICNCKIIMNFKNEQKPFKPLLFLKNAAFPDVNLIDDFDAETIMSCAKKDESMDIDNLEISSNNVSYLHENNKNNSSKNFELEFDFDSPIELNSSPDEHKEIDLNENLDKNFDIGDIEDIFVHSSPDEAINEANATITEVKETEVNVVTNEVKEETIEANGVKEEISKPKEALGFFGLDSIDDIFADSDDSGSKTPVKANQNVNKSLKTPPKVNVVSKKEEITAHTSQIPNPTSPSILSGKPATNIPSSPILCSQVRKFKLSTKKNQPQSSTPFSNTRRQLIPDTSKQNNNDIITIPDDELKSNVQNSLVDTSNKSMFTITQLVDMINKTGDKSTLNKRNKETKNQSLIDDRSTSPILLTQADKKKPMSTSKELNKSVIQPNLNKRCESLIILESDSDSDDNTQEYNIEDKIAEVTNKSNSKINFATPEKSHKNSLNLSDEFDKSFTPASSKRKLPNESDNMNSPYFNKKQKLNNNTTKKLTLQEKVLAVLSSNKMKKDTFDNDSVVNFVFSPSKLEDAKQKENKKPEHSNDVNNLKSNPDDKEEYIRRSNLEMLQMFRRDSQVDSPKCKFNSLLNSQKINGRQVKAFDDSDDDFIDDRHEKKGVKHDHKTKTITNHKVRKKKKTNSSFLDLEAEQSGDSRSEDELSDASAGSIIDFICDESVAHHADMQAHYMRSVKSPVNGVFKIPQLPKRYENTEILSQYVEEDAYEMDSFCVDSHIGLTQANDVSELEVAEMLLEQRKKRKRRIRDLSSDSDESPKKESPANEDSPVVRRKKKVRNRLQSDSDDSG